MSTHHSPTVRDWLGAARPHTWGNAFAPVLAGLAATITHDDISLPRALLAAVVAWALIIGVNFANDYSDGVRGTDDDRTGPTRITAAGVVQPQTVKYAAFAAFAVAAAAGITLSLLSAWWLILIGAVCILAAWFYTGGDNPYGYRGLGEVAVFIFFGLVAVMGTEFTQSGRISWVGLLLAIGMGAISASVNLVNNLRDIPTDTQAGKVTLAVRLGDANTRTLWLALVLTPVVVTIIIWLLGHPTVILSLVFFARLPIATVRSGAQGTKLIPVLGQVGQVMTAWAALALLTLWLPTVL
ncbi:1,4-dihydroxy-2-naphthoate polyprenyltransferase [Corynebacterium sp. TAE3-ERU12]|uniref:1,4-dihydroxy-2-naphthoate polyprenyltransferase n=1 Tax=Corynebacterium sp. TAE3-ERU12 TaxID=2849491 RepID=UPI001C458814|nr:1,4-dihydroxy-2-naphthoate polyprenyltransferase [Corynebacterium sp. TAE3-ERU12]MBV7294563.1 1,4-dihydroxy-2-naphthoate polyprenyltransferase [Corynebacterium sp. TAE3-ERU12]